MNIEQQEHRICEIIRTVCERNDVGVTFSAEPASATGATVVCATYDLGRARRRKKAGAAVMTCAAVAIFCGMIAVSLAWDHPMLLGGWAIAGGIFGAAMHRLSRGALPPPVSRHFIDQQIAYALSAEGHSVIPGTGKTEIYFPEEP